MVIPELKLCPTFLIGFLLPPRRPFPQPSSENWEPHFG
jgi:hypothetical protein